MFITCQGSAAACLQPLNARETAALTSAEDKLSTERSRSDGRRVTEADGITKAQNDGWVFLLMGENATQVSLLALVYDKCQASVR